MQPGSRQYDVARRKLLLLLGGAALNGVVPFGAPARAASISPHSAATGLKSAVTAGPSTESVLRARDLLRNNTVVDFHTHLGLWQTMGLSAEQSPLGQLSVQKLLSNLQEYLDAGCNLVYMDVISDILRTRIGVPGNKDRDFLGDEAWEDYLRQYALMQDLLQRTSLVIAHEMDAVPGIIREGKLAVIYSSEGAHMIERDLGRLKQMVEHGLQRLQPLHYLSSELGDLQTDPPRFEGLSKLGKELVQNASELGVLLDMAHATQAVVEQTLALTDKPLALSHTMVSYESARFGDYRQSRARWITPQHARLIADSGGVIGTFPIPAPWGVDTVEAFVEAVLVMVDTVGIEHVCWSTDLIEFGRPKFLPVYQDFEVLCARLLEAGFSDADLLKFAGGNALRVQASAGI